jgi:hypothetical protein
MCASPPLKATRFLSRFIIHNLRGISHLFQGSHSANKHPNLTIASSRHQTLPCPLHHPYGISCSLATAAMVGGGEGRGGEGRGGEGRGAAIQEAAANPLKFVKNANVVQATSL